MKTAVIGSGAAAISAIETFRKYNQESHLSVISRDKSFPYSKVLLPYFLMGKINLDEMFYRSAGFYDRMNTQTFLGRSVIEIDATRNRLHLDNGEKIRFDKLLISTGSTPVTPSIPGLDDEPIGHIWTLEEALKINQSFQEGNHLLIIGGGFISLMLAWTAYLRKMKVTVIELMSHVLP